MTDPVTKPADTPVMEAARRIVAAYEEHRKTFPYEPRLDPGAEGREKAARRDLESANNAAGPLVARALIRMHAALKDALLRTRASQNAATNRRLLWAPTVPNKSAAAVPNGASSDAPTFSEPPSQMRAGKRVSRAY